MRSWSRFQAALGVLVFILLSSASSAAAGDERWWDGFALNGTDSQVLALLDFDGDLIVGGRFQQVAEVPANRIARWDGTEWHPYGSGMNQEVSSLIDFQGTLVAAGQFTQAGSQTAWRIARWDGSDWQPMGAGFNAPVHDLAIYNGELIAVGDFTASGTTLLKRIARWDGSGWRPLGTGIYSVGNGGSAFVWCALVHAGRLYVGGSFDRAGDQVVYQIASWDGLSWSGVEGFPGNSVESIVLFGGSLFVDDHLAMHQWDGSTWHAQPTPPGQQYTFSLATDGTFVYAAGSGTNLVSRWDGSSWQALGANGFPRADVVGIWNGNPIAGGYIYRFDGKTTSNVVQWNGSEWEPFGSGEGLDAQVEAFVSYGTDLIAAGGFTYPDAGNGRNLARWDGSDWHSMGVDLEGTAFALAASESDLYVGGAFNENFGSQFNAVAHYDGVTWDDMGGGFAPLFPEDFPWVSALAVWDGGVVAGGTFQPNWEGDIRNIAFWDGSSWSPLGILMSGGDHVSTLLPHAGSLYAGGDFTSAGPRVARYDGNTWVSVGGGTNGAVDALAEYGPDLIAAGSFTMAGGEPANGIARWDGSSWSPLGGGLTGGEVSALHAFGDLLFATGEFTHADSEPVQGIASWDGAEWSALGSGFGGSMLALPFGKALCSLGADLYVGGSFNMAGGRYSNRIARWLPAPPSDILDASVTIGNDGLELLSTGPVPVLDRLTLRYAMSKPAEVVFDVYDALGRHLAARKLGALGTGDHALVFETSTPGVFFARLSAGEARRTTRFVVVR